MSAKRFLLTSLLAGFGVFGTYHAASAFTSSLSDAGVTEMLSSIETDEVGPRTKDLRGAMTGSSEVTAQVNRHYELSDEDFPVVGTDDDEAEIAANLRQTLTSNVTVAAVRSGPVELSDEDFPKVGADDDEAEVAANLRSALTETDAVARVPSRPSELSDEDFPVVGTDDDGEDA